MLRTLLLTVAIVAEGFAVTPSVASQVAPEAVRSSIDSVFLGTTGQDTIGDARAYDFLVQFAIGTVLLLGLPAVLAFLTLLVKSVIDHRRWLRLTQIRADTQSTLLDRLTASDDLLTYIQTPAGRRPLETLMAPSGDQVASTYGRIVFSVQVGTIVAMTGGGIWLVSQTVPADMGLPLGAISLVAIAVGVGFLLSALAAYLLSQRFKLLDRPPAPFPHE